MADFQPADDTIKTNPVLSNDSISKSLEISNDLDIDVDPIKNFTPQEDLNNKIQPVAKATRMIANESDVTASAMKPDAEKLSGFEKNLRNAKIELEISDTRKKITDKVMINVSSENGNALTPDDQLELDNLQIQMEDLQTERKGLNLTMGEEVATGDVVGVFNDMYQAAKESPWATAAAATGGFLLGGPAGAFLGANIATSGGNAAQQLNVATAQTYQDLADATDDLGNPLDHNTKKGIAFASGVIQSGFELTGDLALTVATGAVGKGLLAVGKKTGSKVATKLGAKLTVKELNDQIVKTAIKDIGFRKYLQNLAVKMAKGAPMEAITEVLQDNTGNFAKAIGQTWTQDGADLGEATKKFSEDFDVGKNVNTAIRAGLTGSLATGVTDVTVNSAVPSTWNKAKDVYNKATGKNIQLGGGETITVTDDGLTDSERSLPKQDADGVYRNADGSEATGPTRMSKAVVPAGETTPQQNNTYHMVDGRPVGLDAHQTTMLGEMLPTINAIRDTNLNIDPDAVTRLQEEHARNIGLDEVFMDKEVIDQWADTPEKRAYVADMLGGDKGVHVDGQRVRLTRPQYFGMQKFGNVKFIGDNTAVTSDGATIADIKKSVEEKKARSIPKANDIQASDSINPIVGEEVVTPDGIETPVDTTNLGVDSTIEEVKSTLKNKQEADAYLSRLSDEEAAILSNESQPTFKGLKTNYKFNPEPTPITDEDVTTLATELYNQNNDPNQITMGLDERSIDDYKNQAKELLKNGELVENDISQPYVFKPKNNAELNKSTFYHGTTASGLNNLADADPIRFGRNSLFGDGLYLTDNPSVAKSYSNPGMNNAFGLPAGKVLSLKLNNTKLINLEQNLPSNVFNELMKILKAFDLDVDSIENNSKGERILDNIENHIADENLGNEMRNEIYFNIHLKLQDLGYDGFSHVGGNRTGGTNHNVVILFPDYKKGKGVSAQINTTEPSRFEQIKEMRERVNAIRDELPDKETPVDFTAIADESVDGYGEFGIIPENIYNNMTPEEQAAFTKLIKETKESLKNDLKMSVAKELDRTANMQERELNKQSEDAIVEAIANDPNTKIVDWFLADDTMKIDPESLSPDQRQRYGDDYLINKRNIYKKGGAKLTEVANAMDVTPDKLLEVLSTSPSSQQAYKAQMMIEKARNNKEARKSATFNQGKLNKTLDDKISFKRKLLEGILKMNPRAGLRLAYTILSQGDKTKIEKSSINAQDITDNTRIGDLKPSTYLNASRRHQNRANEAMMKSRDMEKAAIEIEKSMIADELFKAGRKTKERVEMVLNEIVRQSKDPDVRKKLESTGHYGHYQALLNMLGQGKLTPKQVESVSDLLIEWQEKGLEPESGLPAQMEAVTNVAGENNGQVDVNNLSLEQIETVKAYIDQLITDSNNIIANRLANQQYFEQDIRTKAEADAKANPNVDGKKANTYSPGGQGRVSNTVDFISGLMDHARGMNEMVDWYEFGEKSIPRMIVHMIKGIGDFAKQGGTFVRDKLWDSSVKMLTDNAGVDTIKRIKSYAGVRLEVSEFMGTKALGEDGKISKTSLISILLIKGSADGDQRLSKLGLDTNTVVETIENYLDKDDIKIVKAIYKVMKYLQPGITHVEKTLKGYDNVEYVDGNSFTWYGEKIEGGYVHFSYLDNDGGKSFDDFDRKLSQMVGDDKAYVNNEAARGYTKEGFKKARVANVDKFIDLDFDNIINKTLGNVVTNNTMLIPIVRSMQILNDKQVSKSLRTVMGKHGLQVFKNQTISAANGLVMDLSSHKSAILEGISRTASNITRNYMTAMILGNLSSVMSNTISWSNVVFGNLDTKNISRSFKFPMALLGSLFIPGVHIKLRNNLEGFIPELTTTKENYQHNDLDNLTLFKNSKNNNPIIRNLSDLTRATSEIWFERVMGLFDSIGKTAYASILLSEEIGKIASDKKAKMSKDDIKHHVSGKVSDELNRYFPSRDSTNIAIMQKHPIGKQLFVFFNDSRVQLNNVYFRRFRDVIRSVTFFPKRVTEKGIGYAVGKGVWDMVTNVAILHLQSVLIMSLIKSFRGEDEEGDRETSKPWNERVLKIIKKSLLDPFTTAKAAGDMIPVVNSAIRYYDSDGKYGYVTVPILNWLKDSFDAGMGLYESKFKLKDMTDEERKALAGFITGPIPNLPMAPVKSYLLGDSTAFQTGMSTITGALGMLNSTALANVSSVFSDTADAMVDQIEEANDPNIEEEVSQYLMSLSEEQYDRLLTYPRGRAVLKRLLDLGQFAAIPPEDVNDIIFLESNGGDTNAYNENSGAAGLYQFLENTWNLYLRRDENGELIYPMAEGLSRAYPKDKVPEGEIDGRYDINQASRMMYILHNEIAKRLITNGIRPSRDTIYMGHHFGESQAVKVLKAEDKTSFKDAYVSAFKKKSKGEAAFKSAVKNNPWVKANMTVGQLKTALTRLLDVKGTEARLKWEEDMGQEFSIDNLQ